MIIPTHLIIRDDGPQNPLTGSIQFDSRTVEIDDIFIALRGVHVDGHNYIEQAIADGANVIIAEELPLERVDGIRYLQVVDSRAAMGWFAKRQYDNRDEQLVKIGVTGTNGKSSVTWFLHQLLNQAKHPCGLIGTIFTDDGREMKPSTLTTPDAPDMYRVLSNMVTNGCTHAALEVSSHAVDQQRISGLTFQMGMFTNFSQDHLDYHGTMDAYFAAKLRFFQEYLGGPALISADDVRIRTAGIRNAKTVGYQADADIRVRHLSSGLDGNKFTLTDATGVHEINTSIVGEYHQLNLAFAYAGAVEAGVPPSDAAREINCLKAVPGRMEVHRVNDRYVIIDYAHSPDALEILLSDSRPLTNGRIITVFGCGGDRDREKRPLMGRISDTYSDYTILTSDNPRSEDPERILDEIAAGMTGEYHRISDRRQAIQAALNEAGPEDLVIIAGKGHETTQWIGDERIPFNDAEVIYE